MTFFGQYLVENGLIDEATLLTALVQQLDGIPAVATVIFQNKLLSQSEQLRILEHQWKTGSEYRSACSDLGLWSEELSAEINRQLRTSRKPLGQILVEAGSLTLKTLTSTLDRFLSSREVEEKSSAVFVKLNPSPVTSGLSNSNSKLDLTERYSDLFDDDLLFTLKEAVTAADVAVLQRWSHSLAFIGNFTGLSLACQIWTKVSDNLALTASPEVSSWLSAAIEVAWDLRCAVFAGLDEAGYLESAGGKSAFDEVLQRTLPTLSEVAL